MQKLNDVTRSRCSTCQKIAKLPPVEPLLPNYPFEHMCVDYMSLNGHQFGVFVDRYIQGGQGSSWESPDLM